MCLKGRAQIKQYNLIFHAFVTQSELFAQIKPANHDYYYAKLAKLTVILA